MGSCRALVRKSVSANFDDVNVNITDPNSLTSNLFADWFHTQQPPLDYVSLQTVTQGIESMCTLPDLNCILLLVSVYAMGDQILAPIFRREINSRLVKPDHLIFFPKLFFLQSPMLSQTFFMIAESCSSSSTTSATSDYPMSSPRMLERRGLRF